MNITTLIKNSVAIALIMTMPATAQESSKGELPPQVDEPPKFADGSFAERFEIRAFAWLETLSPPLKDPFNPKGPGQQYAFYDMELSDGSGELAPGIYATTGPFPAERSNRIYYINQDRKVDVFREGLNGSSSVVLGTKKLPLGGGLLVTEPYSSSVQFVSQGAELARTVVSFQRRAPEAMGKRKHPAAFNPALVRPNGIAVGPDIFGDDPEGGGLALYISDYNMSDGWNGNGGKILRIPFTDADSLSVEKAPSIVAEIPVVQFAGGLDSPTAGISSAKALKFDQAGVFSDGTPSLLAASFTIPSLGLTDARPEGNDSFFVITPTGREGTTRSRKVGTGLAGIMYPDISPAGDTSFAPGLYIPTLGTPSKEPNGGIYIASPSGETTLFITNVNATSVVFDHKGVMGAKDAMYFATFDPYQPGVVWQVVPR